MEIYDAIDEATKWLDANKGVNEFRVDREMMQALLDGNERYRALYEGAMKKIQQYRDVAAKPDICSFNLNKDRYTTHSDMRTAYKEYKERCCRDMKRMYPFDEWLFMCAEDCGK